MTLRRCWASLAFFSWPHLLGCALAFAACGYDPQVRPGVVGCVPGGAGCPAGYACVPAGQPGRWVCDHADSGAAAEVAPATSPEGPVPDSGRGPDEPAAEATAPVDANPPPDSGPGACAGAVPGRGPDMIDVPGAGFCIDSSEVTNRQYLAFLADTNVDLNHQVGACLGKNSTLMPDRAAGSWPPIPDRLDHPVVGVDWCDAHAFCGWAGKRLCGKVGGGALTMGTGKAPRLGQWAYACTRGGLFPYPYGVEERRGKCNLGQTELPLHTRAVKSDRACMGGYEELYDMLGNVEEWIDLCHSDPALGDVCGVIGGSYTEKDNNATCVGFYREEKRQTGWIGRGFRCCSP